MADFQSHEPCPACNSDDNLARYDDGSAYCFTESCGHWEPPTDSTVKKSSKPRKPKSFIEGECVALAKRGISEETCKFFGYKVGEHNGRKVQLAPYFRDGKVIAQKLRDSSKGFAVVGEGKTLPLFGQNKWRDGGKKVIITEGEIDCMSVSQLQSNKWPVVSIPNGASGASKTIAREIGFLEGFEQVVFAFDMDEPGQNAAKECAALISPGKAYIADLPMKDANECLQHGQGKGLLDALWGAKKFQPVGLVTVEDVIGDVMKRVEIGQPWPWPALTEKTYGRRRGEMYGFGGGTGCGKSTIFKQVACHIIDNEHIPVGLLMLEEPVRVTIKTMAGMHSGKRFHVPGVEYNDDELREAAMALNDKVHMFDVSQEQISFETIQRKIRYMVHGLGCKDIFLDHLTAIATSFEEDERKSLDKIMARLSNLAVELDCTLYFVSHLTTPDGTPHEEGGRVLEKHFRGSRSIAFWSHFLFGIERDKQDLKGVTTFRVLKDRYTGDANGLTFGLAYQKETGLLTECPLPKKGESDGSEFDEEDY